MLLYYGPSEEERLRANEEVSLLKFIIQMLQHKKPTLLKEKDFMDCFVLIVTEKRETVTVKQLQ